MTSGSTQLRSVSHFTSFHSPPPCTSISLVLSHSFSLSLYISASLFPLYSVLPLLFFSHLLCLCLSPPQAESSLTSNLLWSICTHLRLFLSVFLSHSSSLPLPYVVSLSPIVPRYPLLSLCFSLALFLPPSLSPLLLPVQSTQSQTMGEGFLSHREVCVIITAVVPLAWRLGWLPSTRQLTSDYVQITHLLFTCAPLL